ncbi:MAG: hypothetical protein F4X94_09835, partial [Dehalococcoidia bacterium]|nr:hypothetical protein [Dehalococcoidia bacterium]
ALRTYRTDAPTVGEENGKSQQEFESEFQDYCYVNLHQPVEIFGDLSPADDGKYPEYERLVGYIRDSGSEFLVTVPDATHLGGDLEAVARAFLSLENMGSKVSCQDDDMPDPLQNALVTLGAPGASRERSEKIRMSMQNRALRGKGLGRPPYGYRNGEDGTLEIVKDESPVVELIFRLYTRDRMGMRLIVQHLNERGITTRRGGNWNVVSIRDILKNTVYIGTYTRFGLRLPGSHEAIIPRDVFREAQDIVRERRPLGRVSRPEPYLLSGIAFCESCGNKMMGVTRRQLWRNKDGNRSRATYRYYQCQSRNNQSVCGYHTWREADLEGAVLAQIPLAIEMRALRKLAYRNGGDKSEQALKKIWEERVRNAERRFSQTLRKTASGALKTDQLERALAELDKARTLAEKSDQPVDVSDMLDKWGERDFDEKRDFLLTHVARVEVSDHMARIVA